MHAGRFARTARGAFGSEDEHLNFHPAVIDDPVPTGLQVLELAGTRPPEEYMVFQLLRGGGARRASSDRDDRSPRERRRALSRLQGQRLLSVRAGRPAWSSGASR